MKWIIAIITILVVVIIGSWIVSMTDEPEKVIAWQDWEDNEKIRCASCGNFENGMPLTKSDLSETDIITCCDCGTRVQII